MSEKAGMTPCQGDQRRKWPAAAWIALVVAGIVLGQFILIGPSLIGRKVLLPLDHLAQPATYLPIPRDAPPKPVHNRVFSDLVLMEPMCQQFAVSELHAGRWPVWTPNDFCGSPLVYSVYSPFKIPLYCSTSPWGFAWPPLFLAVFTGLGAYFFCRRVLQVGPWPATIAAWCWPLTGFFVLWLGYNTALSVGWLPWMLWIVDRVVRRKSRWAGVWLAPATCLTIVSGQFDIGAQVLLVSGLYALWCLIDEYGLRCFSRQVLPALATLVAGWGLGLALAAIYLLPLFEYSQYSSRLERRSHGEVERPPIGPEALPQVLLPDMYGSSQDGSIPMFPKNQGNQLESSAATYTGLLATLLLMPLAWCSRRHRSINLYWLAIAILGLSWSLGLPGFVELLKLPVLNMMSHNRLVFATSFAILAMMAVGLDVLWQGEVKWRFLFWAPIALTLVLLIWCGYQSVVLPKEIVALETAVREGLQSPEMPNLAAAVERIKSTRTFYFSVASVLCVLALGNWAIIGLRGSRRVWFLPALAIVLLGDLLWFAYGRPTQCDPAMYFPRIPALEQVEKAEPGRFIGFQCLPAMLGQSHNLRDVRGYDGVDPTRMVELLKIAADPGFRSPQYAATQWLAPKIGFASPTEIRVHPILDMLNVRYVVFRGNPPANLKPEFTSPDYWVMKNPRALPRVFVPQRVEMMTDKQSRLAKLAELTFNPRQIAYVEEPVELPTDCRGDVKIVEEIPTRIKVSLDMQTPGLVVLSDRWDSGWHAYYDGKQVPILQTDHALRGIVAPEGKGTLEFRYEPAGLAWGLRLGGLALLALTGWAGGIVWFSRSAGSGAAQPEPPTASPAPIASSPSPVRKRRKK
jgi:hypothetical protein